MKTNLLFFTKGGQTERVWYYDLSRIKVTKKQPLTLDRFEEFFALLPSRGDSDHSWTVARDAIEASNFDLKAVNPNAKSTEDTRTPRNCSISSRPKGARSTRRSPSCGVSSPRVSGYLETGWRNIRRWTSTRANRSPLRTKRSAIAAFAAESSSSSGSMKTRASPPAAATISSAASGRSSTCRSRSNVRSIFRLAPVRVRCVAMALPVGVVVANELDPNTRDLSQELKTNLDNRAFVRDEGHFKPKTITDLRSPGLRRQSSLPKRAAL